MADFGRDNLFQLEDFCDFISDTASLIADTQANNIGLSLVAAQNAGALANKVEFWRWLSKNFHCLEDANAIQEIAKRSPEWLRKILQGKGYEWDFMEFQRKMLRNLFVRFDAGTSPTQYGIDITKKGLFSGRSLECYQNKAYTSGQTPDLHNTPKSAKVVTNAENVQAVEEKGYSVVSFQDNDTITKNTNSRMKQAKKGTAYTRYTPKAVVKTMALAGLGAAVIGVGIETISSYKQFKNGSISKAQYIKEIIKTGALSGTVGATTAGIMIPVSGVITAAGIAQPWLFPISFGVSTTLNKIIAPMFKRGEYEKLLNEAKYYQSFSNMQIELMKEIENSVIQLEQFRTVIVQQTSIFNDVLSFNIHLNDLQSELNKELSNTSSFEKLRSFIESI